jgi:hypothetical protein
MEFYVSESKVKGRLKGDVWMKLGNNLTREQIIENPDRQFPNLIVDICSELIASWAIGGNTGFDLIPGVLTLAVGTGDVGWDIQNPPPELADETQLYAELTRKTFATVNYVAAGVPSPTRTNIVDFLTTFLETEAVGPLVEMGLFGGLNATTPVDGTMVNVKNFKVINKPSTSQLSILWRLTF